MFHFNNLIQMSRLMRLDKPIGIFLLLWPALIALWIAGDGRPDPFIVIIFLTGTIIMRSAGCVINDIIDWRFDKEVKRTKERPLAKGTFSRKGSLYLFFFLITCAFLLVLQLNISTILLAFLGLSLVLLYPWLKRCTHLPQCVLGLAFAMSIPMAFTAQNKAMSLVSFVLYFATIFWTIAYDTQYAMVDRSDDVRIGVKSTAILFGKQDKMIIFGLQLSTIFLFYIIGKLIYAGFFYYFSLFITLILILFQQYLIKDREPELCFKAFLNNNYVGFVLFMGIYLDYMFKGF